MSGIDSTEQQDWAGSPELSRAGQGGANTGLDPAGLGSTSQPVAGLREVQGRVQVHMTSMHQCINTRAREELAVPGKSENYTHLHPPLSPHTCAHTPQEDCPYPILQIRKRKPREVASSDSRVRLKPVLFLCHSSRIATLVLFLAATHLLGHVWRTVGAPSIFTEWMNEGKMVTGSRV